MAAGLTLAVGFGAATALFAVVHAVLLRPLPFTEQDRLVLMWERDPGVDAPHIEVSLPNFEDWRSQTTSFSELAAIGSTNWGGLQVRTPEPFMLEQRRVSGTFFTTLGVRAALGRTLRPTDAAPGAPAVMVLSHAAWRRHFDADPTVVGRTFSVGPRAEPTTLAGVMPEAFRFPSGVDVWAPVEPELAEVGRANQFDADQQRGLGVLYVIGRLAPGVELDDALAEMDTLVPAVWAAGGQPLDSRRVAMQPLPHFIFGTSRTSLYGLLGAVGLLLAICVANVAGLQVVRGCRRRRELGIQIALGAGWSRLVRLHVLETVVLFGVGALFALPVASTSLPLLVALVPDAVPRLSDARLDATTVGVAAVVTVLSAALSAAISLPPVARVRPGHWLRSGTPTATASRSETRVRLMLVGAEVALALVLVGAAGLLTLSYVNLSRLDLGFRPAPVLDVAVARPSTESTEQTRSFFEELIGEVDRLPGVEAVGATLQRPFEFGLVGSDGGIRLDTDLSDQDVDRRPGVGIQSVTPGYFSAMGIELLDGRLFTRLDDERAPGVVVIGASLARRLWGETDPLGRRLIVVGGQLPGDDGPAWQTVVGVVADVRHREIASDRLDVYVPFFQVPGTARHLVVRTGGDPTALSQAVGNVVRRLDEAQVVGPITTLDDVVATARRPWRFSMTLSAAFGAIGVLLATVALGGTVAYGVTQRTREVGVRRALGAQASGILRLVAREALGATIVGAVGGALALVLVVGLLRPLLFGVDPRDPLPLVGVGVGLVLVCSAAAIATGWRATRIEPTVALRSD